MTEATPEKPDEKALRQQKLGRAYSAANKTLRENHAEEFSSLMRSAALSEGVVWTPRQTAEEKAAVELKEILAKFPNLRGEIRVNVNVPAEPVAPSGITNVQPGTTSDLA